MKTCLETTGMFCYREKLLEIITIDIMELIIVLEVLHKLWKHHTKHLRKWHQRNEHKDQHINKDNPKFKIGQSFIVKNHTHNTFEPKYLLDYRVLKVLNDSIFLLTMPHRKKNEC